MNISNKKGFTLAEVLITLAIIGIVSAIVIPTVVKNYNDRKYNTARLKALKTFGDAGRLASINDEMNSQANATDFVNNVLSKYLKITKVCDNAVECNFPSKIQPSNSNGDKLTTDELITWCDIGNCGTLWSYTPTTKTNLSIYVETADGYSAKIFYNFKCHRSSHESRLYASSGCGYKECGLPNLDATCMNVIYDMNGLKGPNHVGEDVGIVATYWSGLKAISVAPSLVPYSLNSDETISLRDINRVCSERCTGKIRCTPPNIDEMSSIYTNQHLTSVPTANFWSSTPFVGIDGAVWGVEKGGGGRYSVTGAMRVLWCVRR